MPQGFGIRLLKALLPFMLLWALFPAFAALRKDFSDLDNLYQTGKLNELSEALSSLKPNSDDERAALGYYNAMLKLKAGDFSNAHQNVAQLYPGSPHGQRSLLELGKLLLLERELDKAKSTLRKITTPELAERFYWLASCTLWQDDPEQAIANAEIYLRMEATGEFAENAYFLIANSYLEQKKAYSAISTLTKLEKAKLKELDEQYLFYRLGYAYEQSEKLVDAVAAYQKGYEMDKYSQVAYLIEDRLFELRNRSRIIDISFLYPYTLLQIVMDQENQANQDTLKTKPENPAYQTNGHNPPPLPTPGNQNPPNLNAPIKLKTKPTQGYWLQAGRFSMEANANKLVVNIRLLNLPAAYYEDVQGGKKSWVVLCGVFEDKTQAENAKLSLSENKINSFITFY